MRLYFLVTPGFFTALSRRLFVGGRDFCHQRCLSSPWVAVINESAASRSGPVRTPLAAGSRCRGIPDEQPREVIGVVHDIPLTLQGELRPVVYTSYQQQPLRHPQPVTMFGQMMFMVRTTGDPISLLPPPVAWSPTSIRIVRSRMSRRWSSVWCLSCRSADTSCSRSRRSR